jgi:pimeloyl-ACP methyl ester carboxylesterase
MQSHYDLGKGYPVVMLHSFNHSKLMWIYQIPEFLKSGYRVICPDYRGHGSEPLGDEKVTIETFADDTIKLLSEMGIKKAVFIGSSAGGYVTLSIWRKRPDLISAMVLAGSKAQQDDPDIIERRKKQIKTLENGGLEEHIKNVHRRLSQNTIKNKPWVLDLVRTMSGNMTKEAIIAALNALILKPDDRDILPTINVPTLIICGEEDVFTPCTFSKYLNENIKGSELIILKDAGHINPLDQPELFNEKTLDFLSRHNIH